MFTIKNVFASEQEKQLPYFGIPGCHNFKSRFKMNDYAVLTKTERNQETDIEQEKHLRLQWHCWHICINFQEEKVGVLHNLIHYAYKPVILLKKSKVMSLLFVFFFLMFTWQCMNYSGVQLKSKQCPPQTTRL